MDTALTTIEADILARVIAVLGIDPDSDEADQAKGDVKAALGKIEDEEVTNRSWVGGAPFPRTYPAPHSSLLNVHELQPQPAPAVSIDYLPLLAGFDYRMIPNETGAAIVQLQRLVNGVPAFWDADGAEIAVLARWAVSDTLQENVKAVWVGLAVRAYQRRAFLYSSGGGNSDLGASGIPSDDSDLLKDIEGEYLEGPRQMLMFGVA